MPHRNCVTLVELFNFLKTQFSHLKNTNIDFTLFLFTSISQLLGIYSYHAIEIIKNTKTIRQKQWIYFIFILLVNSDIFHY